MEALAIISHLLQYVLAIAAVYFCVTLFRRGRALGWLFVSAIFLEPFYLLIVRAISGRPLLSYKAVSAGPDNIMHVTYRWDFPVFYILAVIGLSLLFRRSQREIEG